MIDLRTLAYLVVGLAYVVYPLYYITASERSGAMQRVFALGFIVYGGLLLYWPEQDILLARMAAMLDSGLYTPEAAVVVSGLLIAGGFGLYRGIFLQQLGWIAAMAYALMVLHWPGLGEPLAVVIAMLVLVAGFDKCLRTAPITEQQRAGELE